MPSRPQRRPGQIARTRGSARSPTSMVAAGTAWRSVVPAETTSQNPVGSRPCQPGDGQSSTILIDETEYPHPGVSAGVLPLLEATVEERVGGTLVHHVVVGLAGLTQRADKADVLLLRGGLVIAGGKNQHRR